VDPIEQCRTGGMLEHLDPVAVVVAAAVVAAPVAVAAVVADMQSFVAALLVVV